ncbi:MAG: hypothetical protein FWG02_11345 [Holophagaceae bacterium]|nr:hypothetical protein [Holophagaceae bacterium]
MTVTLYDPAEEARRLAEFNRLSVEPKVNVTILEIKQMSDFRNNILFYYDYVPHTVDGCKFVVSATVTDPILKAQLEKEAESLNNDFFTPLWAHEFHHADNAKYRVTIKESENRWKAEFLDEVSASLIQSIINQNILDVSSIDADKAKQLLSQSFDLFYGSFDNPNQSYRLKINDRAFGNTNFISVSYDTDEFFQKGLNAMFTYKIGDKDVNLFELMTSADREAFLTKLNTKMQLEYERYHSGYYD